MGPSRLPTDAERLWLSSVHGQVFERDPESEAPVCASCHDAHGGHRGDEAVRACGRCHEEEQRAFDAGPHAAAFRRMGFVDCAECHSNHGIRKVDVGYLLNRRAAPCRRCHAEPGQASEAIERFAADVVAAEEGAEALLTDETADAATRSAVERSRDRLRAAVHRLDADVVGEAAAEVLALLESHTPPAASADAPEGEATPYTTTLAAGAAIAIVVGALAMYFRRRRRRGVPS
jgi:hypothetical protein